MNSMDSVFRAAKSLASRTLPLSLVGLAMAAGACGQASPGSTTEVGDTPTLEEAAAGEVLFFDDFSDPSSGWKDDDIYYFRGYDDGAYRISIDQDESQYVILTAVSNHSYGDVSVEVDAERVSGSESAGIYLICRYQDNDNYYYAEIDGEGILAVAAFFDNEQVVLIDDFPTGLIPGQNHFQLDCIGSELTIFIDGVRILNAAPLKILEGDVGFGAGGSGRGVTNVRFDNFTVRSP